MAASQPRPQAEGVVRADTSGHFWPDFVVCLSHFDGAEPQARVIETKENVKDAARKAHRAPITEQFG